MSAPIAAAVDVEDSAADPVELPHARRNWTICILICIAVYAGSFWMLANWWTPPVPESRSGGVVAFLFHVFAGLLKTWVLALMYFDKVPNVMDYGVMGHPEVPRVKAEFSGIGRWVMFTVWSNTLCAVYFVLSAVADGMALAGSQPPQSILFTLAILWDVIFPMSFLVNSIVTFVLYKELFNSGKIDRIWYLLNWRGEVLHNGFVILTSIEAVLLAPTIEVQNFCILMLYGATYICFAWCVFLRKRTYAYYFIDPRFDKAPVAIAGLVTFLVVLFLIAGFAVNQSREHWWVKIVIMAAALGTCTWKDPRDAELGEPVHGVGTVRFLLNKLTHARGGQ